jgi:6-phosphogluconolactonase
MLCIPAHCRLPMNPIPQIRRWHVLPDADALAAEAATRILAAAQKAIAARGAFRLVLTGGRTPRGIYRRLGAAEADWARWHVYLGDERCLPPDDPERNSRMAAESWLDASPIPRAQIHMMPAELGATAAAAAYAQTLAGLGDFDLVLLGLGEDGHVASLFPGHERGSAADAPDALPVFDAPKPPPERVSLGARRLSAAREVLFLVSGEGKRPAVAAWNGGADIPAAAIAPVAGVDVLIDFALPPG